MDSTKTTEGKKKGPTILDVLNANLKPCYDAILDHLETQDMFRLFATCKTIHDIYYCVFNVDPHLRPFFDDHTLAFRQAMADHNLIVGGSVALKFFSRDKWPTKDLDVYTSSRSSLRETSKIFTNAGFKFEPFPWQSRTVDSSLTSVDSARVRANMRANMDAADGRIQQAFSYGTYTAPQIRDVYRFNNEKKNLHIDMILTNGPELLAIIEGYYATYIMNFFTYNRAYNLFPYHTILQKEGFQTYSDLSEKRMNAMLKYLNRGYKITNYGKFHECKLQCPIRPHRRVGDTFTWTVDLGIDGIRFPKNPMQVENCTFGVKGHRSYKMWNNRRGFSAIPCLRINTHTLEHKKLEYPLLVDNRVSPGSWKNFLETMLAKMFAQEEHMTEFEELADPYLQGEAIINGRQQYFDKDVAAYYKFWYQYIMPRETLWSGQYPMLQ
ncbi:hypothetical protein TWF730_003708 [Orbilia blumenaviensis]|uniref:Uncharacterized protein n=1 Tax=Orbilia blumenaviensis TaxID=1796055 RepID=A0AAV9U3J0_9PEZI